MPLIKVETSAAVPGEKRESLVRELSETTASVIGKPESYVAVVLSEVSAITFGGDLKNAAFVEVRSIGGLSPSVNKDLSAQICDVLGEKLGISSSCVYINFMNIPATDWGFDGRTFG